MGFTRYLLRRLGGRAGQPRFVRRVTMRCPHAGDADPNVEIELLMGRTGMPSMVMRCSHRQETPPTCDQACRHRAEAVVGAPRGLLLIPAGHVPPERRG
jgi:hypothetical protein